MIPIDRERFLNEFPKLLCTHESVYRLCDDCIAALSRLKAQEAWQDGVALIAAERLRQVSAEGWTPEHDDLHQNGEMAVAAACYAWHDAFFVSAAAVGALDGLWPWESSWWKPSADPIRNLVRAGALIAAEIDRHLRAIPPAPADSRE